MLVAEPDPRILENAADSGIQFARNFRLRAPYWLQHSGNIHRCDLIHRTFEQRARIGRAEMPFPLIGDLRVRRFPMRVGDDSRRRSRGMSERAGQAFPPPGALPEDRRPWAIRPRACKAAARAAASPTSGKVPKPHIPPDVPFIWITQNPFSSACRRHDKKQPVAVAMPSRSRSPAFSIIQKPHHA